MKDRETISNSNPTFPKVDIREMTVEEIKVEKEKLQSNISQLISEFEAGTRTAVTGVVVKRALLGYGLTVKLGVEVTIEIK